MSLVWGEDNPEAVRFNQPVFAISSHISRSLRERKGRFSMKSQWANTFPFGYNLNLKICFEFVFLPPILLSQHIVHFKFKF